MYHVQRSLSSGGNIKKTKTDHRVRKVDLIQPLYDALVMIMPDKYFESYDVYADEFIFKNPYNSEYWKEGAISKIWSNALKDLNIPHRRAYQTRDTYASIMVTACLPDQWLRQQMGHASMRMLSDVYAKWLGDADGVIKWILKHTEGEHNSKDFKRFFIDKYKK